MTSPPPDWEVVFRDQLPKVYNYFLYSVNDQQLAEDLTSTTFERAWQSRETYRTDIAAFSTWLMTIARRVRVDYFRKARRNIISLDSLGDLPEPTNLELLVQKASDKAQLAHAIARLPEREQDIIALKYGAEMTNRAIANLLDLSESNIGTILQRTVKQLRGILLQQGDINYG